MCAKIEWIKTLKSANICLFDTTQTRDTIQFVKYNIFVPSKHNLEE